MGHTTLTLHIPYILHLDCTQCARRSLRSPWVCYHGRAGARLAAWLSRQCWYVHVLTFRARVGAGRLRREVVAGQLLGYQARWISRMLSLRRLGHGLGTVRRRRHAGPVSHGLRWCLGAVSERCWRSPCTAFKTPTGHVHRVSITSFGHLGSGQLRVNG